MSQDPPVQKSYIPAIDPTQPADEITQAAPPPANGLESTLKWVNCAVAGGVVLVVGAFAWSAVQSLPPKDKRPQCGIDWVLWACGSKETFNTALQKKLDSSSHAFDDIAKKNQSPDLQKLVSGPIKFEPIPTFDVGQFNQPMRSSSTNRSTSAKSKRR